MKDTIFLDISKRTIRFVTIVIFMVIAFFIGFSIGFIVGFVFDSSVVNPVKIEVPQNFHLEEEGTKL